MDDPITSTATQAASVPETGALPPSPAVVEPVAYSEAADEPPDTSAPWWRPATLAAAILTGAGLLAGVIYLVGKPALQRGTDPLPPPIFATRTNVTIPEYVPSSSTMPPPVTVTAKPEPSPVAAPEPQMAAYDQQFIAMLRNDGWNVANPGIAAENAHRVCAALRRGESPADINARLVRQGDFSMDAALVFTADAMIVYPNCRYRAG